MKNRTQSVRFRFLVAAATIAVLAPILLLAGPGRGGRMGGPGMHDHSPLHGIRQLDLTEEQREQLHTLMATQREEGSAARQELREARVALAENVHAETFDESGIRVAAQQVAALEEDHSVERALIFQEVRKILTDEQLAELEASRVERRHGRRGGCGSAPEEGPVGG